MKKTKVLVYVGLFIALSVILTRFLSVETPTLRIGFGIIPIAFSSIMFGPLIGGITGALSDFIGAMLFPKGPYFFGFTLTAFLDGILYGLFLYNKPKSIMRIILCVLTSTIVLYLGLNTYWISIITGKGFIALLPQRIIKNIITVPINAVLIYELWKYVGNSIMVPSFKTTNK